MIEWQEKEFKTKLQEQIENIGLQEDLVALNLRILIEQCNASIENSEKVKEDLEGYEDIVQENVVKKEQMKKILIKALNGIINIA